MTEDDWQDLWQEFEETFDAFLVSYQEEMEQRHGKGYYHLRAEDEWAFHKKLVQTLVEEKNGDARSKSQSEG